ncbi:MAG: hypothetical protein FJW29_02315 [Acidobacteria bacterium]|nr:hypothetical protein [Acidobacteriota bacterium]
MNRIALMLVTGALVVSVACGKSDAEKQAEEAAANLEKASEALSKAAEGKGSAEDLAEGMKALTDAMNGDGKTVDPVSFQSLEALLPSLSGWERDTPRSERMTSPVAYAQTEAHYSRGDASLDITITDSGFAQAVLAPFSMMAMMGMNRESREGYEKGVTLKGQPGFEEWRNENRDGELTLLVGKRFLVAVKGSQLPGAGTLQDAARAIDFGKLAALQ